MAELEELLPTHIRHQLQTFLVKVDDEGYDEICWGPTKNGNFSLKSGYDASLPQNLHTEIKWKHIRKLQVPTAFIWLLYHGKILTNKERIKRGLTANLNCHHCLDNMEDIDHIFRHCLRVKPLWTRLSDGQRRKGAENSPFKDWFGWNMDVNTPKDQEPWKEIFVIYLWWIWRWRNEEIFKGNEVTLERKSFGCE